MHKGTRTVIMIFLCLAGAALNIAVRELIAGSISFGFFDTIFTIALTFCGGVFWGMLCGALTNVIGDTIYFWGWAGYLFAICNMATAVVTWLFIRLFPRELSLNKSAAQATSLEFQSRRFATVIDRVIVLMLLSFGLCIAMSVLGGLIAAGIQIFNPDYPGNNYVSIRINASMFRQSLPLLLTEVLARIPVNSIDRLISAFAGFGIAWGGHKLVSRLRDIE